MPRTIHMVFMVDELPLEEFSLPVLRIFPISIFPPLLHIFTHVLSDMESGILDAAFPHYTHFIITIRYPKEFFITIFLYSKLVHFDNIH